MEPVRAKYYFRKDADIGWDDMMLEHIYAPDAFKNSSNPDANEIKEVKEGLNEIKTAISAKPLASAIEIRRLNEIKEELDDIRKQFSEVKEIKEEVDDVRSRIRVLSSQPAFEPQRLNEIKEELDEVRGQIRILSSQPVFEQRQLGAIKEELDIIRNQQLREISEIKTEIIDVKDRIEETKVKQELPPKPEYVHIRIPEPQPVIMKIKKKRKKIRIMKGRKKIVFYAKIKKAKRKTRRTLKRRTARKARGKKLVKFYAKVRKKPKAVKKRKGRKLVKFYAKAKRKTKIRKGVKKVIFYAKVGKKAQKELLPKKFIVQVKKKPVLKRMAEVANINQMKKIAKKKGFVNKYEDRRKTILFAEGYYYERDRK
ncbi:MAG: hypothetical protein HYW25_00530 [Candidatus Aenigmarchaeota archaeon]|nr:hypothetical protein [Candidatus Aenigmarchaeota archaeon]